MKTFEVTQDYNREKFMEFLSDFLPEDYTQEEDQVFFNYTNIEEGYKLGTCGSLDLDVFEFRTKSNRDPRVTLTREAVSFMKNYGSNQNALVVFYTNASHNWRFSLITTDYEIVNNKVKPLYSNPRRFSFRLGGECKGPICEHTENGKIVTAIEDLKNRFALEVVSKQFFDEYKVFYEDFVQFITGNRYIKVGGKYERKPVSKENTKIFNQFKKFANDDYELSCKYVRDYIKKFMGRLVFLQFLQKKGWLGVETNSCWGNGNKNFLLDLFTNSKYKADFLEKVLEPLFFGMLNTDTKDRRDLFKYKGWDLDLLKEFKQIPYLNGGLFENEGLDDLEIKFPQEMFSNPAKADKERIFNDKKDYSKEQYPFTESCGLLDFFARYNFTIDETDPADMEIGVEPEMLGKIFENLLEDNKDKGAFYTPKEIVQYMCRESLIAYLGDNEKNRKLVIYHISEQSDSEKKELIDKLRDLKVCDPAVGSGAFPMGMLNELFACRVALGDSKEAAEIKKEIVRENIYGVDIEKGAVDIARLRFWLAIIVDEKEPIPLPNLDYKIMQGNSLLESYDGVDLSKMLEIPDAGEFDYNEEQRTLLKTNMDEYFDDNNHENKSNKNKVIKALVYDLVCATCGLRSNSEKALDMHEKVWEGTSDFFLWHTWFSDVFNRPNDCNGFDIVIGNPPYVFARDAHFSDDFKKDIQRDYYSKLADRTKSKASQSGKINLFALFIMKGIMLSNKNGILSYIVPNNILRTTTYDLVRRYILDNTSVSQIVDLGSGIFEKVTASTITIQLMNQKKEDNEVVILTEANSLDPIDANITRIPQSQFLHNTSYAFNIFGEDTNNALSEKIAKNAIPFGEYCIDIISGVCAKKDLVFSTKESKDLQPMLVGKSVKKYMITEPIKYLKWDLPNIDRARPDYLWQEDEKIITQRISGGKHPIVATLDCSKFKTFNSINNIVLKEDYKNCYKFFLALLNSNVLNWYYANNFSNNSELTVNISKTFLEKLPIPQVSETQINKIMNLVEEILSIKKASPESNTTTLEYKIDSLIYSLYELTPEEIATIEDR